MHVLHRSFDLRIFLFSANSKMVFGREPPFTTRLVATVDIAADTEITTSYVDPLMSGVTRRPFLANGW